MLLGVILGFAALGLLSSAFGDGETDTYDPVDEDGLNVAGSPEGDLLQGGAGNDRFVGDAGDDLLIGAAGDDTLLGGDGADSLHGGDGDDFLRGGAGDDLIVGGDGADDIRSDTGDDRIISAGILDVPAYETALNAATPITGIDVPLDPRPDADMDTGDEVDAGYGDDHVTFGSDDTVTGGAGADLFELGDWVRPGAPATVTDFDPDEDVIAYSFAGPEPVITTTIAADGTATVFADGEPFLVVANAGPGFSAAQIELRPR